MTNVRALAALGVVMAVLVAAGAAQRAEAGHGASYAPNSNSHTVLAFDGGASDCSTGTHLLKIDVVANGTYTLSNGGQVIISNYNGTTFDWAIAAGSLHTIDANVVLVKGGRAQMAYFYDTFDDSDTNLTAPINPRNGKPYGISHVEFCFDPKA